MKTTTLAALIFLTTACTTQTTQIYQSTHNKQCEPPITTLSDSTRTLTSADIEVRTSSCAIQTGMAVMTVCGAPTLGIYLHEIKTSHLQKAKTLGYEPASYLINQEQGTGYELTTCP